MTKTERNKLIKEIYEKGLLEELYKDVVAEEKKSFVSAGNVNRKHKIVIEDKNGKETWTAIAYHDGNVVFLLDEEYEIENVIFGKNNNYTESNARDIAMTCDPVVRALKVLGEKSFVPLEIDLWSHDGFRDYGICKGDLSGMMTYDMYRRNRENIEPSYMWLSTPDSTPSGTGVDYVRFVRSGGRVSFGDCDCDGGVRPFFILKSNILVSLAE